MHRSFLVFGIAFIAMMAGALFYAARLPLEQQAAPVAAPAGQDKERAAADGPVIVDFALADMDGQMRAFSEWEGRHRILNFWATWCAPCRREIPLLKAFQDAHADEGLQVIGIAVDFVEPVVEYARAAEFNYPILVGEQEAMAVAEASGVDFIGLPFTMFVARDGELIGTHMGEIHAEQLDRVATVLGALDRGEMSRDAARAELNAL